MTTPHTNSAECRAAVMLAMIQALSLKQGYDSLGTEEDRRRLASMGPEERFRALQIEFVALAYRLETREIELRGTRTKLEEVSKDLAVLQKLHSVESRRALEEEIIAKHTSLEAKKALELHSALEQERQKLKNAIDADLMLHLPRPKAVVLEDLLREAKVKPKDSSTRSRLHALLAEHREGGRIFYPVDEKETMVAKIQAFAKETPADFDAVVDDEPIDALLPWNVGGKKRKHPVDKAWDSALDAMDRCRAKG